MRRLLLAVGVLTVVIAAGWSSLAWVAADAALLGWSAGAGTLHVPAKGLAVLPRWSVERFPPGAVRAEVVSASRDGVAVTAAVRFLPPVGRWALAPGSDPTAGLEAAARAPLDGLIGGLDIECLLADAVRPPQCPAAPARLARDRVALDLGLPANAVEVELRADADAARAAHVAAVAGGVAATGRRVLVLGLDALDWRLILPWVREGRMPNLDRLMRAGCWGEMDTIVPMLSPIIWTTMATGLSPDQHGVLDFVERDPATNQMVPVTGRSRTVPAIWNIASAVGFDTATVGWWATWPAERVRGTMVADRLYYTLAQGIAEDVLRHDPADLVFPRERLPDFLQVRERAVRETDWSAVRHFMNVSERAFEDAVAANRGMNDPIDGFRRILAATRTYLGSGLLLAEEQPDLLMIYLEGTDTIGHLLAPYMPPPTLPVDAKDAAVWTAAVPRYFEVVDRWIGRYLESCPLEKWTVIVLSDHGFKWGDDRPRGLSGTAGPTAPMWHAEDAAFVVAGPGVARRGHVEERASVYQVAPSIAALLGIPPDRRWRESTLPGCPRPQLEPVDWPALVPPSTYRQAGGGAAPVDEEFIAKLEALGYLAADDGGGADSSAPAGAMPEPSPTQAVSGEAMGETTTRGQLNNLGLIKLNSKEFGEAERLFRQAVAMAPRYAAPHYNLRRLYMELGRYEEADRELWASVDKGLRDPERSLDRAAADYESLGLPERAETLLRRAVERFPGHEPFWVHIMVLELQSERCADAAARGAEAARRFPSSAAVHAFYGLAAACAGDSETARVHMRRSLELDPDQPTLRQGLAELDVSG